MGKRTVALTILVSAVMLLVVAAPLATADTHIVVKGGQGPRASAVSWEIVRDYDGLWYGRVVNSGLRSLVVEVEDITSGAPISIMEQRIRFAAYPTNTLEVGPCIMAKDRVYLITATPNGPRGSSCTIEDLPYDYPTLRASFTFAVVDMTVYVDGSSSTPASGIIAYGWEWGDGTTGTGMTTQHTYAQPGIYVIMLTVLDIHGMTSSVSLNPIIPPPPPVASFTWTYTPDWYSVLVNGSGSYAQDGVIVSYAWDFGDGYTAIGKTATHSYMGGGSFLITLEVTDSNGLKDTTGKWVQISPVVVTFTISVSVLTVAVDASGVVDPGRTIVWWAWDWGDGATGSGMTAVHTYAGGGIYLITLTATDNNGLTITIAREVQLNPGMPPIASFTHSVSGFTVSVDASTSTDEKGIVDYVWNWGDGSPTGHGVLATHSYTGYYSGGAVPMPYPVFGYLYNPDGSPMLSGGVVKVLNTRTGGFLLTTTDAENGFYIAELYMLPGGFMMGDVLNITVWGAGRVGYREGVVDINIPYLEVDVTLSDLPVPPLEATLTLTVFNTVGLSGSVSHKVTFAVP